MQIFYNRKGELISKNAFYELFSDINYRILCFYDDEEIVIATVWMGVDFDNISSNEPMIFETIIMGKNKDGKWEIINSYRHSSEESAMTFHNNLECSIKIK